MKFGSRFTVPAFARAVRAFLSVALATPLLALAAVAAASALAQASVEGAGEGSARAGGVDERPGFAGTGPRTEAAAPTPRTRRYADVKSFLFDLVSRFPRTASGVDVGPSDSGDRIYGVALGDLNSSIRHMVVAAHHGNEYGAVETALGLAESLASAPLTGQLVFVIPVLNVGGYDTRTRWERGADRRFHDPNRDYPGPCGTEGPFSLKSTRALAEFVERENIVASATLHTYWPAVLWPWGAPARELSTPYDLVYKELAASAVLESGYQIGNSTEVLYAARGAYEDYVYWRMGAWSLLFELGGSHSPSDADVAQVVAVNVEFTSRCDAVRAGFDRHDE